MDLQVNVAIRSLGELEIDPAWSVQMRQFGVNAPACAGYTGHFDRTKYGAQPQVHFLTDSCELPRMARDRKHLTEVCFDSSRECIGR